MATAGHLRYLKGTSQNEKVISWQLGERWLFRLGSVLIAALCLYFKKRAMARFRHCHLGISLFLFFGRMRQNLKFNTF